ncbi:hypothetical protein HPP92_018905 [Vanilla planifolia]|uniref:Uncharacterized protein n=1 Tax=Vanilla planifolia TaxID=51239 RepID=A0A835QAS2_VANPL|nr:hypothetical protein HPP92_018905 [Vanilla planifolia]
MLGVELGKFEEEKRALKTRVLEKWKSGLSLGEPRVGKDDSRRLMGLILELSLRLWSLGSVELSDSVFEISKRELGGVHSARKEACVIFEVIVKGLNDVRVNGWSADLSLSGDQESYAHLMDKQGSIRHGIQGYLFHGGVLDGGAFTIGGGQGVVLVVARKENGTAKRPYTLWLLTLGTNMHMDISFGFSSWFQRDDNPAIQVSVNQFDPVTYAYVLRDHVSLRLQVSLCNIRHPS